MAKQNPADLLRRRLICKRLGADKVQGTKHMAEQTTLDRLLSKLKNNLLIATIIVGGIIIIGIAAFNDAVRTLVDDLVFTDNEGLIVNATIINERIQLDARSDDGVTTPTPRSSSLEPPILDLKLVNHANRTALVTGLVGRARRGSFYNGGEECYVVRPTGYYHVLLDPTKDSDEFMVPLSHALKPNETDRILVSFAVDHDITATFDLEIEVQFDEGEKVRVDNVEITVWGLGCTQERTKTNPAWSAP